MSSPRRRAATEWANTPSSRKIEPRVVAVIARRRRQMLIHSYLYYRMDSPIVEDDVWSKWAQQLSKLQDKFGWKIGFYDGIFADWDGSSGFHLPADADVVRVARRVHDEHRERESILG